MEAQRKAARCELPSVMPWYLTSDDYSVMKSPIFMSLPVETAA